MKLACLSDIHGNTISLERVLADIEANGGVDGYRFIGDYAAIGYDPVGVLERITTLPNAMFVRGNTERYTYSGRYYAPPLEDILGDLEQLRILEEDARIFAWTQGALTATGWLDWITNLPLEHRFTLPDGTRVLLAHASPGRDDGDGVRLDHSDDDLREILAGCDADLVLVGHTHIRLDRTVDGVRVMNGGSLSNPHMPDLRASYMTIFADGDRYEVEFHWVDYDHDAVIQAIKDVRHPASDHLIDYIRGKRISDIFKNVNDDLNKP